MESKICKKCKKKKSISEFYKDNRTKDKVRNPCKKCLNTYNKNLKNKYPWKEIFYSINQRCNNSKSKAYKWYGGRGIKCLITKKDIKNLWFRDKAYKMKKPSINRKDNGGNYIFSNCEFIELSLNCAEKNKRIFSIPILQYNKQGIFIKEWASTREASRILKISPSGINGCLIKRKHRKSAGGFKWKYK